MGWELFCSVPSGYNLSLIREFYAEVATSESYNIRVRGTKVSYDSLTINNLLGVIPPPESMYTALMNKTTEEDARKILKTIGQPGATWKNRLFRTMHSRDLLPQVSVWFYFLRYSLQPTTHDSSITFERMIIIYCIMNNKKFSVGDVISKSIRSCVGKTKGDLWHPSLIHALLTKAKVRFFPTDELVSGKAVIEGYTVRRVMRNAEKAMRRTASAAATVIAATATATVSPHPARVPRTNQPTPPQQNLEANSFMYLVKTLEKNQEALLKKIEEKDGIWMARMEKQKKEMEKKIEDSERRLLACLKEQDKAALKARKLTALHRHYEMIREGVMEADWAMDNPNDYATIGPYPPELIIEAEEFLPAAKAPPTHK